MSTVVGLPHQKRPAFIKGLTPKQPLSRVIQKIALILPGESYNERKAVLMQEMRFSRQYIRVLQWNADLLPEVKHELYALIQAEQHQMRATFDELVALKRELKERVKDAEKNGFSD